MEPWCRISNDGHSKMDQKGKFRGEGFQICFTLVKKYLTWGHDCFDSYRIIFLLFGFQGHHFKIVGLPNAPYNIMNPSGYTADGSTTYKLTGYLPEVLDNLKVSYARICKEVIAMNICWGVINGEAGKAAALSEFSDTITLSQPGWADQCSVNHVLNARYLKGFLATNFYYFCLNWSSKDKLWHLSVVCMPDYAHYWLCLPKKPRLHPLLGRFYFIAGNHEFYVHGN